MLSDEGLAIPDGEGDEDEDDEDRREAARALQVVGRVEIPPWRRERRRSAGHCRGSAGIRNPNPRIAGDRLLKNWRGFKIERDPRLSVNR